MMGEVVFRDARSRINKGSRRKTKDLEGNVEQIFGQVYRKNLSANKTFMALSPPPKKNTHFNPKRRKDHKMAAEC